MKKQKPEKWEYAVLNFKVDFLLLNPEVLPESYQKKYKGVTEKFLESFADIMKIHTENPNISAKAYSEVFGDK